MHLLLFFLLFPQVFPATFFQVILLCPAFKCWVDLNPFLIHSLLVAHGANYHPHAMATRSTWISISASQKYQAQCAPNPVLISHPTQCLWKVPPSVHMSTSQTWASILPPPPLFHQNWVIDKFCWVFHPSPLSSQTKLLSSLTHATSNIF